MMRTLRGQPQLVAIFIIASIIVDREHGLVFLLQVASLQPHDLYDNGVTLAFLRITLVLLLMLPIQYLLSFVLDGLLESAPEQILVN